MGFAALRVWLGVDPDNTHKPTEDGPLCIVCASPSVGGYRVPCQHRDWWCGDCLTASIQVASGSVTDPSAFPPRCHGVPIFPTLHFGLSHDHAVFRSLPVGTREAAIRNWALALSRAAEHEQGQGSIDAELVRTILSSGRAEYQFCPRQSCHRLISRVDGCNHMTCYCGQEFCYVCGAIYDGFFTCGHTHYGQGSLATSAPPAPAPPANLARLEPYPAPPAEPNHLPCSVSPTRLSPQTRARPFAAAKSNSAFARCGQGSQLRKLTTYMGDDQPPPSHVQRLSPKESALLDVPYQGLLLCEPEAGYCQLQQSRVTLEGNSRNRG